MGDEFNSRSASRSQPDELLQTIADYVCDYEIDSEEAWQTAHLCLKDSLACALLALKFPECGKLLGPLVPGLELADGARVPGTPYRLDPVQAAFNIGTLVRYLDFNDTWLAAEWGHPSDNLGAILAVADWHSRANRAAGRAQLTMAELLKAMIKAHEIQGVLALKNSFNRVGLDHVLLVRIASTAVVTHMLGGSREDVINALSQAWLDGGALRAYRHAPNTGPRKSWAAGDACRRAVQLSLLTLKGEIGYPTALTARGWGFQDVLFGGKELVLERELGSYVMENILFKIAFPAEFHAQTAVECAFQLHSEVVDRLDRIERVEIETQEAGSRIIDKTGPLDNYADRDHCIQYMVAIGLVFGELTAESYSDRFAADPRIDGLREKMTVKENPRFTKDYFAPDKRAIGNSVQVFFTDGASTERVSVDYPVGHRRRRDEGIPLLEDKFEQAIAGHFSARKASRILPVCADHPSLERLTVPEFTQLWAL
ncbi:MAG: bifunctional 2-methylcitrate dehydratase/aconitate hydratase [Wenzhouxiangella sp.]|nr:MAG: bifunctional 2-methylcitrate dehydratase/aconitate hydratase [Wenzhouxiangella sp.]